MRPFPTFHTHLFQVWDSLSAAFPSAKAPTIKAQLLCSYSQLQEINRTKYWAVICLMSFGVLFFLFLCVCGATTVRSIIQGHSTEAAKQKWSNKPFLPLCLGPYWCDYSEQKGTGLTVKCESLTKRPTREEWKEITHDVITALCGEKWSGNPYFLPLCTNCNFPSSHL